MILSIGIADLWTPENLLPGIICNVIKPKNKNKNKKKDDGNPIVI